MALVKFGGGVAAMSGSIGGTVFSRSKAGAVARNWAHPTNTPTLSQSTARNRFADVTFLWNALNPSDKDGWNAAAQTAERLNRLGDPYTPSGRQMFMEVNLNAMNTELTPISDPPSNWLAPELPAGSGAAAVTTNGIPLTTATITLTNAPLQIVVQMVAPNSGKSAMSDANLTTLWRQVFAGPPVMDVANLAPGIAAAFPGAVFAGGDVLQFRMAQVGDNGVMSDWVRLGKVLVTSGD